MSKLWQSKYPNTAGASARRDGERRDEDSYLVGGSGEELVGRRLDALRFRGVLALHDRKRLRSSANIDHIAIAPAGVFVIDAKRYAGPVRREHDRVNSRPVTKLRVDRRNCSQLLGKVRKQVVDVGRVLIGAGFDVPIRPVLCFVDADWGPAGPSFTLDRVLITSPERLLGHLFTEKAIDSATTRGIAELLDRSFLPA